MDAVSYSHADDAHGRLSGYYYTGEAAPSSPELGMEWAVPSSGKIYKYINDGTSDVWVDVASAGGSAAVSKGEDFIIGTPSNNYTGSTTVVDTDKGYTVGSVYVYVEGMLLNADEYVADDGLTITLNVARTVGDSVRVVGFGYFTVADHYTKAESDAAIAAIPSPVYNTTLTSTADDEALAASQGKVLKDSADTLATTVASKIEADNYATSTVGGTVKARLDGSTFYLTINGNNA